LGPFLPRQILGFRRGRLFVEKSTSGHYSREGAKSTLLLLALRPTTVANSFQDNSARWGNKSGRSEIKILTYKKTLVFYTNRTICFQPFHCKNSAFFGPFWKYLAPIRLRIFPATHFLLGSF
jgi:hypothetical protein